MEQGFISRLFDFSFRSFVTTSIIKVLYILSLIGVAVYSLFIFVALASAGGVAILAAIIVAPLVFAIGVIFARVYMEILIVLFRIAENTDVMARHAERQQQ